MKHATVTTAVLVILPVGFHIRQGNYGVVKLDDLDVVDAYSWPKAIHEGNGTHQIFITNKAIQQEQKDAIINIFSGKAKGNGYFALFASTIKYQLDPQFAAVHMSIDGRRSSFSVPGIIDVKLEKLYKSSNRRRTRHQNTATKGIHMEISRCSKNKNHARIHIITEF